MSITLQRKRQRWIHTYDQSSKRKTVKKFNFSSLSQFLYMSLFLTHVVIICSKLALLLYQLIVVELLFSCFCQCRFRQTSFFQQKLQNRCFQVFPVNPCIASINTLIRINDIISSISIVVIITHLLLFSILLVLSFFQILLVILYFLLPVLHASTLLKNGHNHLQKLQ